MHFSLFALSASLLVVAAQNLSQAENYQQRVTMKAMRERTDSICPESLAI